MNESIRYDKGLGNAAIYSRIPNAGQFWDFVALAWSNTETANCRAFMTEFDDTSATQAWYYAGFTPPNGGPFSIEIILLSTGEMIGSDLTWSTPLIAPGTVTCAAIIGVVARQLQDITNIAWPAAVLLNYLNYAVREIVDVKPEANSVLSVVHLAAGTRQDLPSGWNALVNAKRNMGTTGTTPGRAILTIPPQHMDSALPDWHSWPTADEVRYVVPDERDPYHYDVFPPQPSPSVQQIELIGSAYPTKAQDPVNDGFPLPDQYEVPACDYMIYRALYESTTIPNALAKANTSLQKFYQSLGVKNQTTEKVKAEGQ